jgi:subtilisin family serine protease
MLYVRSRSQKLLLLGSSAVVAALAVMAPVASSVLAAPSDAALSATDRYIVVIDESADARGVAESLGRAHGLAIGHVYENVFHGFAAVVPPARVAMLESDPRVVSVQADGVVSVDHCIPGNAKHDAHCAPTTTTTAPSSTTTTLASTTTVSPSGQSIPTGVARSGGPGSGPGVPVAVIDTGIDLDHPDLRVVGGVNCSSGPSAKYDDGNGHGTHVAGTIGALDNGIGVVGVAPGTPLYAVRVLNNAGTGFRSDVICGVDWVAGNANTIAVANMSLGGSGSDDGKSCLETTDAYKKAICGAVDAGVTFVVAAGNESDDAANHLPAAYDDVVITVSALADFDGESGGGAAATCRSDVDDTFADFSNYGPAVDIIAPGVCIRSTWSGGGYNTISGTSMATPHVTGAASLYLARNPEATPADVETALEGLGNIGWDATDDPDDIKEPLLQVDSL